MPLTPVQRAEALLTDVVLRLYAAYRDTDFPESHIRSLKGLMHTHLHQLRNLDNPIYRCDRAKPVATLAPLWEQALIPAGSALVPLDERAYRRLHEAIHGLLGEAVAALLELGVAFAQNYVETSAYNYMAGCLRWLREQETPAEREALIAAVNRLRASIGLEPTSWEQLVGNLPLAPGESTLKILLN